MFTHETISKYWLAGLWRNILPLDGSGKHRNRLCYICFGENPRVKPCNTCIKWCILIVRVRMAIYTIVDLLLGMHVSQSISTTWLVSLEDINLLKVTNPTILVFMLISMILISPMIKRWPMMPVACSRPKKNNEHGWFCHCMQLFGSKRHYRWLGQFHTPIYTIFVYKYYIYTMYL